MWNAVCANSIVHSHRVEFRRGRHCNHDQERDARRHRSGTVEHPALPSCRHDNRAHESAHERQHKHGRAHGAVRGIRRVRWQGDEREHEVPQRKQGDRGDVARWPL